MRVVLVCSSGGHLIQLHQLKPWWEKHERTWVTFDLPDGRSLLEGEDVVWAYHPTTRNLRNAVRNLMLAVRFLPRYRPDLVVSGINNGQNIGDLTTVSGTVGAALGVVAGNLLAIPVLNTAENAYGTPRRARRARATPARWRALRP